VFKDGCPVFVQNSVESNSFNSGRGQYAGCVITCVWGENCHDLGVLGNMYHIRIEDNAVRLDSNCSPDEFTSVQFMALEPLVERLNGALRSRQDYDFTDLYQALQLLFVEFVFEMYVKLW
jgi:hypothetical protein